MRSSYGLCFTKVVGTGNDFIVIDNRNRELDLRQLDYPEIAKNLCRRRLSVGADGLLVLEWSDNASYKMRIINPDGSEVDMCGNGARCSAYYASQSGWGHKLTIETRAGMLEAQVSGENVKLKMSDPKDIKLNINLGIGSNLVQVHHINTGVPHAVHFVEKIGEYDVMRIGRGIRAHSFFAPNGTNADFIGDIKGDTATIRTYERGVEDETLACGTGAVASAIIMGLVKDSTSPVELTTKSGEKLKIHYKISGDKVKDVYLEGTARIIYEGKV